MQSGPARARLRLGALALLAGTALAACAPVPASTCPDPVAWQAADSHEGQVITLRGPVVATRFAPDGDGQPTFLDIGSTFPDVNRVTVVIWGRDRQRFTTPPEQIYHGKMVCVTGVVDRSLGTPSMVVRSPDQVAIQ